VTFVIEYVIELYKKKVLFLAICKDGIALLLMLSFSTRRFIRKYTAGLTSIRTLRRDAFFNLINSSKLIIISSAE